MKKLLTILSLAFAISSFAADTNQINTTTNSAPAVGTETNLNQILVGMLSDARSAGKEIYGASKEALKKSVDFVFEQSPEIVRQFLTWKFMEASIKCVAMFLMLITIWFIAWFIYRKLKKYEDDGFEWMPILIVTILTIMTAPLWYSQIIDNGLTAVKIKVAPKVYLIEYVIDKAQGK